MGCVLDPANKSLNVDVSKNDRRGRINTIDTRKKSTRVVDKII